MEIRAEKLEDVNAVRQVNVTAFKRENEADLVDRLPSVALTFSFVAVESKPSRTPKGRHEVSALAYRFAYSFASQIVGHIFYSPVEIEGECDDNLFILGLAPIAVLPEHQRQGIGSLLIQHSLSECARLGCKAVVVLSYPEYYPKFGFVSAKEKGLRCEYKVPDEAFMVLELKKGALEGCSGIVKYRSEFGEFE